MPRNVPPPRGPRSKCARSGRVTNSSHLRGPSAAPAAGLHELPGKELARSLSGAVAALVERAAGAAASGRGRFRFLRILDVLHRLRLGGGGWEQAKEAKAATPGSSCAT